MRCPCSRFIERLYGLRFTSVLAMMLCSCGSGSPFLLSFAAQAMIADPCAECYRSVAVGKRWAGQRHVGHADDDDESGTAEDFGLAGINYARAELPVWSVETEQRLCITFHVHSGMHGTQGTR